MKEITIGIGIQVDIMIILVITGIIMQETMEEMVVEATAVIVMMDMATTEMTAEMDMETIDQEKEITAETKAKAKNSYRMSCRILSTRTDSNSKAFCKLLRIDIQVLSSGLKTINVLLEIKEKPLN